ncbi:ABC transporter permease subunit [Chitinophaga sp. G-6-1-13]|uniref:ABC transporter permease subunit n=1 Tax=Chitinophaga fulva TaxID=2728842 RepID=A0A848GYI4_9BACT|nr:Gldg family protein [Chitinophaga fulva]NML40698.1 ABC transporter permease subunit [Chitinophaga fulva]
MKTIIKIAKTELRTLFYSPIVWFLMIAFLVQCGLTYMGTLERYLNYQESGGMDAGFLTNLTHGVFLDRSALFDTVMEKLYLYIPLLTMGLVARETSSGTMRLLYSSPVKVWQIVLGKYAATMVYSLIMVAIAGIFMVAGIYNIQSIDIGILLSAALGFYLLLCTYAAIGLFMSCLTTYQVVAAVCTFVTIAALSYIGTLWQDISFVRDLTYFLSLAGRARNMQGGLISTSDVLYFLLVTGMFLAFSYLKLKGGMESRPLTVKGARYAIIVVLVLLIGYVSSRPRFTGYYDTTAYKARTLTPNVQRIVKELNEGPLEVTVYNNLLNRYSYLGLPQYQNNYIGGWQSYLRFKPDISFHFVNYYDSTFDASKEDLKYYKGKNLEEVARQKAKGQNLDINMFKTPEEIRKKIDLKPELNRFVLQLRYKGKATFLRIFDDVGLFPNETEVAAAFKRLQQTRPPRIVFLTGELERSIHKSGEREYRKLNNEPTFRYALINQGFDVDTVSAQTSDIPADIAALVVADPKASFSETALTRIREYIDKGGNLLVAGEPGKQAVLNPLLQSLGVQLMDGVIAQPSKDLAPDLALSYLTGTAATFTKPVANAFGDSMRVSMPGATGLTWNNNNGFTVKPLLISDAARSWIKKDRLVTDSGEVAFSAANGDERKSVPLALSLSRKVNGKEQRIIVTGDADFVSNNELMAKRGDLKTANFYFSTSLFSWLCYGEYPIDATRPETNDKRITLTPNGLQVLKIFLLWVLPGMLLATGAVILIMRKRR